MSDGGLQMIARLLAVVAGLPRVGTIEESVATPKLHIYISTHWLM